MAADESLIIMSGRLLRSQFISLNTFHQTENYTKIKAAGRRQKHTKIVLANKCSYSRTIICAPVIAPHPLCNQLYPVSLPRAPFLYLCFSFLLIVSIPCQCLSLLSINLPNKRLLSSPPRRLLSTTGASSPHRPLLSDCWLFLFGFFCFFFWRGARLPQSEL